VKERILLYICADADPGKKEEFVRQIRPVIRQVQQKSGCVDSRLFQDFEDNNAFFLNTEWESRQNLDAYLATGHFCELGQFVRRLCSQGKAGVQTVEIGLEAIDAARGKHGSFA
jgi:quinol monooxygenase YgiN